MLWNFNNLGKSTSQTYITVKTKPKPKQNKTNKYALQKFPTIIIIR